MYSADLFINTGHRLRKRPAGRISAANGPLLRWPAAVLLAEHVHVGVVVVDVDGDLVELLDELLELLRLELSEVDRYP